MRARGLVPAGALVAIGALVWSGPSRSVVAQDAPAPALDVAALFRASCADCHLAPDPAVPTDAAFLRQVNETA